MPPIRYVGPHDEVEIAATGQVVKQGETVDAAADIVGRAPSGAPTVTDDDGVEMPNPEYDPGAGLLAQVDAWQPGKAEKSKPDGDAAGITPAKES